MTINNKLKFYLNINYTIRYNVKLLLILLITVNISAYSQTDWVNYLIKKEKGFMAVTIDLDFNNYKPNYKNLLIVGTDYKNYYKNGFPNEKGLAKLYAYSDTTAMIIDRYTKNQIVGIITYHGTAFDIFYVKDTIQIRENLKKGLEKNFSNSSSYIYLKKDKNWRYYFDNLFPENVDNNLLANHQYLFDLLAQGDNLSGLRKINHWVSFKNTKKRLKFINQIKPLDFVIDSIQFKKERKVPYALVVSRKDSVNPKSINQVTQLLQLLIEKHNGIYAGWGTERIIQD